MRKTFEQKLTDYRREKQEHAHAKAEARRIGVTLTAYRLLLTQPPELLQKSLAKPIRHRKRKHKNKPEYFGGIPKMLPIRLRKEQAAMLLDLTSQYFEIRINKGERNIRGTQARMAYNLKWKLKRMLKNLSIRQKK